MKRFFTPVHGRSKLPTMNSWWRRSGVALLFSFIFSTLATAQTKIWDRTYGGFKQDYLRSVQPTPDGGYILGGTSNSEVGADKTEDSKDLYGSGDYWIVKLKGDGTKEWDKTLGGTDNENLAIVKPTSDGGYIVGGTSDSPKSGNKSSENKGSDFWIVKLNKTGHKVWDRTIGGDGPDQLSSLQQTADGGYILGGSSNSPVSGDKSQPNKGENDYWIVKLNADGSKVWDKTVGGKKDDNLATLQLTPDGGYILGGISYSGKSGDKTEAATGGWLVKLKADGTKVWDKTFTSLPISSLTPTTDGSYLLGGTSGSYETSTNYRVVKVKTDGSIIWEKTIVGNLKDNLVSVQQTQDGGYLLGGSSNSEAGYDKREKNQGIPEDFDGFTIPDYWIVKLKADGTKDWDKTIGGNEEDWLANAFQTQDGNYILAGYSYSRNGDKSQGSRGIYDYWIVKLDNNINPGKEQHITFKTIPNQDLANSPITLKATATSGLPVSFRVVSGPATVENNQLTFTGTGTVTVKAQQAGNATFDVAREVFQTFNITDSPVTQIWNKTFGGVKTGFNIGSTCGVYKGTSDLAAIINTQDGGYLLAGTSDSEQGNDKSKKHYGDLPDDDCFFEKLPIRDYWLVKTDAQGNKLWDKTFGGTDQDKLVTMITTTDGGIILGGFSLSNVSGDNTAGPGFWLVKTDAQGNKLWDKSVEVTQPYGWNPQLVATTDGGFLLTNTQKSIIKMDSKGNKVWEKALPTTLVNLLATADGGFLIGRTTQVTDPTGKNSDFLVLKLDANGKTTWEKTYGGPGDDALSTFIATPDGGYLLGVSSQSKAGKDKTEGNKGQPDEYGRVTSDYWVIKLDGNGTKLWDKTIGGDGSDNLVKLVATPDGGYLLGGNSGSSIGGDKSESKRSTSADFWVVKLDGRGQKVWDKTFGGLYGRDASFRALIATPDGSYLLGGITSSPAGEDRVEDLKGYEDFWVIKIKEKKSPATTTWDLRYGGYGTDNLTAAIKTQDGGYLSGGYTNSGATGDKSQVSRGKNDYWIVKSDANGKKEWDQRFGGYSDDYLNSAIQTPDGGYLLAGSSFSQQSGDKSQTSRGSRDYWIVKTDQQGNKLWDQRYGGTGEDELKKVIPLASGGYILAGSSNSPQSGDKSQTSQGQQDYWIVKINADGQKLWDRTYGGTLDDLAEDVTQLPNGDLLLGGSSTSGATGDRTQGNRGSSDFWVLRLNENGAKIWDRRFGGSREDQLSVVGTTPTGNIYLAGTTASQSAGDLTYRSRGLTDYWLLELTGTGTKVWDRLFGGNLAEELRAVQLTKEGNYLLAGSSRSGKWLDKTQPSQGGQDYWVVEANRSGVVWEKRYGGSQDDELRAMVLSADGGYVLAGRSSSGVSGDRTQPRQGSGDYWLVKAEPTKSASLATRTASAVEEPVSALTTFTAYPNPFQEKVTIHFTLPETQAATLRVLDNQGRAVTTLFQEEAKANQTYQVEWQAGKHEAGMYLLQLQTPTGQQTQKLLLNK